MGGVAAWLDPRAVLAAYARADQSLEAARAQRPRMIELDIQYLSALEEAWKALPSRVWLASAPLSEEARAAGIANVLQLAGQLDALTARIVARADSGGAGGRPSSEVPNGQATPADSGWSLPELPSLPSFPGVGLDLPILLLLALGLGLVAGER